MTDMQNLQVRIEAGVSRKMGEQCVEIEKLKAIVEAQTAKLKEQAIELANGVSATPEVAETKRKGASNGRAKRTPNAIQ